MIYSNCETPINYREKNLTTYCQLANSIANSTSYQTLLNPANAQGTLTIPANYFRVGDLFTVNLKGHYNSTANSSNQIKYLLGSTILFESAAGQLPSTAGNNTYVDFMFYFQIRAIGSSGKVVVNGRTLFPSAQGITTVTQMRPVAVPTEITIDTTIAQTFDAQYLWGSAVGSMTIQIANITKGRV